jgi:hypothetical protein
MLDYKAKEEELVNHMRTQKIKAMSRMDIQIFSHVSKFQAYQLMASIAHEYSEEFEIAFGENNYLLINKDIESKPVEKPKYTKNGYKIVAETGYETTFFKPIFNDREE